jgi:hypothetical protein
LRQTEVDDVRPGVAVVVRQLEHAVALQPRHVVDLREHLDVARAVVGAGVGLPEPARQRLEVGRALLGRDPEALAEDLDLALAEARDHDPRDRVRHVQEARDPVRRHECGHGDLHDGDVVVERQVGAAQRVAQGRRREPAGDEEQPLGYRVSLLNTNLFGVPSSGLSGPGRQSTVSSIWRATAKSLSVMPPAAWFFSLTQSLPQVTDRSAWW